MDFNQQYMAGLLMCINVEDYLLKAVNTLC